MTGGDGERKLCDTKIEEVKRERVDLLTSRIELRSRPPHLRLTYYAYSRTVCTILLARIDLNGR